jgi:hypothetical protein
MPRRIPITSIIGLVASALAVSLWTLEQLSWWMGFDNLQMIFETITIPVKLVVLLAPFLFLSDLSSFLYKRPQLALRLGLTLIAVTLIAILLYLPWRSAFAAQFSNDGYRWYHEGSRMDSQDFMRWKRAWSYHLPHMTEVGIVLVYYTTIIGACSRLRLNRAGGAALALIGYLFLHLIPMFTGLILWDYDTFLKGIVFDSISMDLMPFMAWHAGDYSIFLYMFMLIFFGVAIAFFYKYPQSGVELQSKST